MQNIKIDINGIREIAYIGVRRAAVFMGLGLNAVRDESFTDYSLTNMSNLIFVPDDFDSDQIKHIKDEFGMWIVKCGLRELIETYSVFLDKIYEILLIMSLTNKGIISNKYNGLEYGKKINKFSNSGFTNKFCQLDNEFGFKVNCQEHLISINQARNCLAHRRGVVDLKDCSNIGELILKWKSIEIIAEKHSGEIIKLNYPIPEDGVILEAGEQIKVRTCEQRLLFKIGDIIKLSPHNLAEICCFVLEATNEALKYTMEFAQKMELAGPTDS